MQPPLCACQGEGKGAQAGPVGVWQVAHQLGCLRHRPLQYSRQHAAQARAGRWNQVQPLLLRQRQAGRNVREEVEGGCTSPPKSSQLRCRIPHQAAASRLDMALSKR